MKKKVDVISVFYNMCVCIGRKKSRKITIIQLVSNG